MGNIAERLRAIRGGQAQKEFSSTIGLKQTTYGKYERGVTAPNMDTIAEICRTLGINPRWLILGEDPMYDADRVITLETKPGMKVKDTKGHSLAQIRAGYRGDAASAFAQGAIEQAAELVARHPEVDDETPISRLRQMEQERDEARKAELRAKDEALRAKDEAMKAKDEAMRAKDKALEAKEEALEAMRALAARKVERDVPDIENEPETATFQKIVSDSFRKSSQKK